MLPSPLSRYIWPSVMYPVRSGIGWVTSSPGMVSMFSWVMLPFFPLHDSRPLVYAREVRVHVSWVAPPSRDLLPRARELPERLAVVRHVRQHDQNVHAPLVREELRCRQRKPRGEYPLDARVVCEVDERDRPLQRSRLPEVLYEVGRVVVRDRRSPRRPRRTSRSCS